MVCDRQSRLEAQKAALGEAAGRFCGQDRVAGEDMLRSVLTAVSQPCCAALPRPPPSPCPGSRVAVPHPGSLAHPRTQGVAAGGRWPSRSHHPVSARVGMAVSLTCTPRTRSSPPLLTRSRSASARTRSSFWCGWWMSSGECFRPRAMGRPWCLSPLWGTGFCAKVGVSLLLPSHVPTVPHRVHSSLFVHGLGGNDPA